MSDCSVGKEDKLDEILNKVNRVNKNVKTLMEMMERIKGANDPRYTKPIDNGTYENKRKAYLTKLNAGEIKEPKQQTLDYYKVERDEISGLYS